MPVESITGAAKARLRIGEWLADATTNELSRDGRTVRVEPKAMEVLMLLADRAGRVVSREEFFEAVWPGAVVGDEALTQSVIKLRKALGDNPRSPSYIDTISKRGYRLIAPVSQGGSPVDAPAASGALTVETIESPRARPGHVWAAIAGALVIASIAAFAWLAFAPNASVPDGIESDEGRDALLTLTIVPFESLGADGDQAYLARGIGNDLLTELSRLPGLRLISASEGSIAPTVRSAYKVSGSVQRSSGLLRVTIHLRDAQTNQQLWSERFERPFGDLFAVQDEIVSKLTQLLPGKVADAARQRRATHYTRSLEAYDDLLRGQALFLVRQVETNEQARTFYRRALERDPQFARAYAGLAMTYAMDASLIPRSDRTVALNRALELAETARLIDPDIPEVHWALSLVHTQSRRHDEALQSVQKAIDLNRSFSDAYALMAGINAYVGQTAKAIPIMRTALRFNPDGGYLYYLILGRAYLFENDVEQALINLREAAARNPVNLETHVYLAAANAAAGDRIAAEWETQEISTLEPGFVLRAWLDTHPLAHAPHQQRLVELLTRAGVH